MAKYYKGNAVYDELKKAPHNFQWLDGNAWILLYGSKSDFKLFVFVIGVTWKKQYDIINTLRYIFKRTSVPVYIVKFDDSSSTNIKEVGFISSLTKKKEIISLENLKQRFSDVGLSIKSSPCKKYLNDKMSSAYHKWQREELGPEIIVTDIDLIRIGDNGEPIEFIELKRSFMDVKQWFPYSDDFSNFNLIYKSIQATNIDFIIAYNQYIKKQITLDDCSRMSIFSYSVNKPKVIKRNIPFEDFLNKKY